MFNVNDRVMTKFGAGTIVEFEHIKSVNSPVSYSKEYKKGDRIGVSLDHPSNWSCSIHSSKVPFFMPADLSEYIIQL